MIDNKIEILNNIYNIFYKLKKYENNIDKEEKKEFLIIYKEIKTIKEEILKKELKKEKLKEIKEKLNEIKKMII